MKIQIENLKAQMRGVQLNAYQRGLALDEYYKLLDYVDELEQLPIHDVVGRSEQLKAEVFTLANKLALAGEGDAAVSMHRIHNRL